MRNQKESLWVHCQLANQRGEIGPGRVSVLISLEGWRGSPQTEEAGGMLPSPYWVAKQALEGAVAGNLLDLPVNEVHICRSSSPVLQLFTCASGVHCLTSAGSECSSPCLRNGKTEAERKEPMGETNQVYHTADEAEHMPAGCFLQLIPLHTCSSAQPGTCRGCFPLAPSLISNPGFATCAKQDSVGRGGIAGRWLVRNSSCNTQTC